MKQLKISSNLFNKKMVFAIFMSLFLISLASAFPNQFHINQQATDSSGDILPGTYNFRWDIVNDTLCNSVVYSKSATLTTDSRAIVSQVLDNIPNLDFSANNYSLCAYRDLVLKSNVTISTVGTAYYSLNSNLHQGLTPQQVANLFTSPFLYNYSLIPNTLAQILANGNDGGGHNITNVSSITDTGLAGQANQFTIVSPTGLLSKYGIYDPTTYNELLHTGNVPSTFFGSLTDVLTNPTFDTDISGWYTDGGAAISWDSVAKACKIVGNNNYGAISQGPFTNGFYRWSIKVTINSGTPSVSVGIGGYSPISITTSGTYSGIFFGSSMPSSGTYGIRAYAHSNGAFDVDIDDFYVSKVNYSDNVYATHFYQGIKSGGGESNIGGNEVFDESTTNAPNLIVQNLDTTTNGGYIKDYTGSTGASGTVPISDGNGHFNWGTPSIGWYWSSLTGATTSGTSETELFAPTIPGGTFANDLDSLNFKFAGKINTGTNGMTTMFALNIYQTSNGYSAGSYEVLGTTTPITLTGNDGAYWEFEGTLMRTSQNYAALTGTLKVTQGNTPYYKLDIPVVLYANDEYFSISGDWANDVTLSVSASDSTGGQIYGTQAILKQN